MAAYVFLGGAIFEALEGPVEIDNLRESIKEMQEIISEMTKDVVDVVNNYTDPHDFAKRDEKLGRLIKVGQSIQIP